MSYLKNEHGYGLEAGAHRSECIPPGKAAACDGAHIEADDQVAHKEPPVHNAVLRPAYPGHEQEAQGQCHNALLHQGCMCMLLILCVARKQPNSWAPITARGDVAHRSRCPGHPLQLLCSTLP